MQPIPDAFGSELRSTLGPDTLVRRVMFNDHPTLSINVHLASSDNDVRDRQLNALTELCYTSVAMDLARNFIVAGDFNAQPEQDGNTIVFTDKSNPEKTLHQFTVSGANVKLYRPPGATTDKMRILTPQLLKMFERVQATIDGFIYVSFCENFQFPDGADTRTIGWVRDLVDGRDIVGREIINSDLMVPIAQFPADHWVVHAPALGVYTWNCCGESGGNTTNVFEFAEPDAYRDFFPDGQGEGVEDSEPVREVKRIMQEHPPIDGVPFYDLAMRKTKDIPQALRKFRFFSMHYHPSLNWQTHPFPRKIWEREFDDWTNGEGPYSNRTEQQKKYGDALISLWYKFYESPILGPIFQKQQRLVYDSSAIKVTTLDIVRYILTLEPAQIYLQEVSKELLAELAAFFVFRQQNYNAGEFPYTMQYDRDTNDQTTRGVTILRKADLLEFAP